MRACHLGQRLPAPSEELSGPIEEAPVWSLEPSYTLSGEVGPSGSLARPDGVGPPSSDLDPEQLAAVANEGRSARIIAPAGSGKTRVLTERARHLVDDWGVPVEEVCLVAFNVRARREMEERTKDLVGLQVRTLNSLGWALLRGEPPFARSHLVVGRPDTIEEREVRELLEQIVKLPRRLNADPAAAWLDAFSAVRLGLRDPVEVERAFGGDVDGLADAFDRFRSELERKGVVDFDEQIYRALEVLLRDPAVRGPARSACRLLLVDEFQDLTPAHLLLIRLVAGPDGVVFGVGDDDQTIYGYTGALPEWLVEFDRFFPGAAKHALATNYRCPADVVAAARCLLSRNARRVAKEIRAAREHNGDQGFTIVSSESPTAATTQRVEELLGQGVDATEIAVLTRVNAGLAPVQVSLGASGIPTTGGVGLAFLDRTGVRAALGWLRIAVNPTRLAAEDLGEAVRRPSRGLSPRLRGWVCEQRNVDDLHRLAGRLRDDRDSDRVSELAADIGKLGEATGGRPTAEILKIVRDSIGLGATVDRLDTSKRDQSRGSHGDDLDALIDMARLQPDPGTFTPWLREQLSRRWSEQGVELATIHRVKGMEWPHVVVHGVTDGVFPHRLADDIEEERRILHVGITRSRRSTTVVGFADAPSPFVAELRTPGQPPTTSPRPAPATFDGGMLRERLRAWRLNRAQTTAKPAFVIFSDRTLDELVALRPESLAALAQIHGIGPAKLDAFGEELLKVLN